MRTAPSKKMGKLSLMIWGGVSKEETTREAFTYDVG